MVEEKTIRIVLIGFDFEFFNFVSATRKFATVGFFQHQNALLYNVCILHLFSRDNVILSISRFHLHRLVFFRAK